jgi:hypothetical protein
MEKKINITFHNEGLRSYIEIDLCAQCPRQDDKGCCGYYSPVFYPSDLAYLLIYKPDLIEYIFSIKDITVLDASVTVNNTIDGESYRCHFHSKSQGCYLEQKFRESICRHFVCPGVAWESEKSLKNWKKFFSDLSDYEIALNNKIASGLKTRGLTLRNHDMRNVFFKEMLILYRNETKNLPSFIYKYPAVEKLTIIREIKYGKEWPL